MGVTIGIPLDGSEVYAEVVGVVGNVRHDRLDVDGREVVYVPYRQEASREVSFVVRTEADPAVLAPSIRRVVRKIDPQLAVYGLRSLESYVASTVAPTRFSGSVLGAFAALALLGLASGLYGVVSLEVTRRTREIGLRMAVGADPRRMMGFILTGGLRTVGWGVAFGGLLSVVSLRFLKPAFYGTGIVDPWAWVLVAISLCLVSGLACWIPAHRAASMDPTVALRRD